MFMGKNRHWRVSMRSNALVALAAALPLAWAAPADAQAVSIVLDNISNFYGVAAGAGNTPVVVPGGSNITAYATSTLPGRLAESGVNYTATASDDSFFFLHDNYCVGTCATYSQTAISFTVTNQDSVALDLRFDSLITPGHIAWVAGLSEVSASFTFDVTQTVGRETVSLYSTNGGVNSDGIFLNTSDQRPFNNLVASRVPGEYEVLDWSATNLNLNLATLGAGESTTITYFATYRSLGTAACVDILDCPGAQVVFGDPRNNGGVTNRAPAFTGLDSGVPPQPVIGAPYDPYRIPYAVVLASSPLPGNPPRITPPPYGLLFRPDVLPVPEPGTWAMLIAGVGAVGGVARRRRPARAAHIA